MTEERQKKDKLLEEKLRRLFEQESVDRIMCLGRPYKECISSFCIHEPDAQESIRRACYTLHGLQAKSDQVHANSCKGDSEDSTIIEDEYDELYGGVFLMEP